MRNSFRAASVFAAGLVLAGCSSQVHGHGSYGGKVSAPSRTLVFDEQKMARDIEQSAQGRSLGTVTCPPGEAVQKGNTFDCHAPGVTIHIKVTSDEGDYLWTPALAGN